MGSSALMEAALSAPRRRCVDCGSALPFHGRQKRTGIESPHSEVPDCVAERVPRDFGDLLRLYIPEPCWRFRRIPRSEPIMR